MNDDLNLSPSSKEHTIQEVESMLVDLSKWVKLSQSDLKIIEAKLDYLQMILASISQDENT